ncbi:MAG: PIG-L family deacetylase [Thermoanaerobaculia bacterium]
MRSIAIFTMFLYLSTAPAVAERTRTVRRSAEPPAPASVLWIAAHPDDEAILAPLLAHWCLDEGARCGFLILTRGEKGECLLPAGCHPDIASVRSAESGAASELFEADLMLLRLPDGGVAAAAAERDYSATIAGTIEAFRPETVITFDPRHGSTCHPDHRETGRLALAAVERLSFSPELLLLETKVEIVGDPLEIRFAPATAHARRFDANASLTSTRETGWEMIVEDMLRHPSQFNDAWIRAIEMVPEHQRSVWYGAAEEVLAREVAGCEP